MRHPDNEGEPPATASEGLTRREALRRGTLAGLGLVWAAPSVQSINMSVQYAQATSPTPETTIPGNGTTEPTTGPSTESTTGSTADSTTRATTESTTGSTTESITPSGESTTPETEDTTVETASPPEVDAGEEEAEPEAADEVLAGELPFTGLQLEQLLPLAGGAIATGAAAVRLAKERKKGAEPASPVPADRSDPA